MPLERFRIHLRNDQRYGWIHSPRARVVHHSAASRRSLRGEAHARISTGAKECNVNATESVRRCFSYGDLFAAEGDAAASGRCGERDKPAHGEVALLKNADHRSSDKAGCAYDGDDVAVRRALRLLARWVTHTASINERPAELSAGRS